MLPILKNLTTKSSALLLILCLSGQSAIAEEEYLSPKIPHGSLTVAEPKKYRTTKDSKLGLNQAGKGLKVGAQVNSVNIFQANGDKYALAQAWRNKPALIVFYRGGWCPFCNAQIRELSVNYHKFEKASVQPVLISTDLADRASMVEAKYDIPFPVLSDPDLKAHTMFNVILTLDEKTVEKYKKRYGIDLQQWSGREHRSFAVSSAFLVGKDGKILFSHAPKDYRKRPSVDQLLKIIADNF